ncbi:TPA: septation initiation protein, partial [Escherichia coli]|nr:septation initiation protein [Escherichia coli]HAH8897657.1 septation initiation protein [Escherichia coli]HBA1811290.1 septation initiation protein [Escherichia coli]HBA1816387.1 septation initiation protein [Escherichia coli]HBA1826661.1 septation initiation protein [Escherichia coli]
MTIPEQNNNPIVEISIPVSTQQALEKVNATKSAWLEARRQQKAAADNIAT